MVESSPQQQRDLRDLYRYDDDPAIQSRENQDLWMQLRGPRGYQAPAAPDTGVGAPLDYSTLLRQLVQMASTPQHPDQQMALRHLVALMQHPALGQGTQVAGDVTPFQGKPVDSYIYTPGNQLYQPGQSTNPGGKPMEMPWWMMYYPWPSANQALLGKPTAGGSIG